jgi:two-component system, response regulator PdtaR
MRNKQMNAPLAPPALVVEDDPIERRVAADTLHEAALESAAASTVEEALIFLREHAPDVRLVLTDMVLPGRLDGIDLARVASLRWPWIKVVVATDRTRVTDIPQNVVFLPKPWRACDLQAQLRWEGERRRAVE